MEFISQWITTDDFAGLKPIDVFHKESDCRETAPSAFENYHVHFVKEFLADRAGGYEIRISADDYYKLYINGQFVCQGPAPAYAESYHFNRIDISDFIKKGKNTIAVHVYYQGLINRVWNSGDNRMGVIADLFYNGAFLLGTDETWLYSRAEEYSGEAIGYSTQFSEDIDFRKKQADWKEPGAPTEGWQAARAVRVPDWRFQDAPVPTVEVYKIKPQQMIRRSEAVYLFDFGQEITGQVFFTAKGAAGQRLCVKYGEELEPDGSVRFELRCSCTYCDVCTLSGGEDTFEFFDYKAFRYVQIECEGAAFRPESFEAIVRHHKFEERCSITSDIPYLEDIWRICKNGIKCGVQEGYLDCPSREKGQYLGDFTVSGLAHLYLTGDAGMYRKTLFDFAESARVCKGLLAVAPGSFMQEIADFSLQYPLQIMNYYRLTGDIDTLKALYPTVEGVLEYFARFERADGLIENVTEKWNLVDWPENLRDGYCVNTDKDRQEIPAHCVLNAFYVGAVACTEEIRHILGLNHENKSAVLKQAFCKAFYSEKTRLFYDDAAHTHSSLHANALPLYFDLAPAEAHESIKALIMQKGLSCGVQFSYFVLKGLGRIGAYDEEFSLLMNDGEHSWINMLREGATACFEAWGKEQKWNTSLCHPWASAPVIIIIEDIMRQTGKDFFAHAGKTAERTLKGGKISLEIYEQRM